VAHIGPFPGCSTYKCCFSALWPSFISANQTKSVGHQTSSMSCPNTYDAHENIRWSKTRWCVLRFCIWAALTGPITTERGCHCGAGGRPPHTPLHSRRPPHRIGNALGEFRKTAPIPTAASRGHCRGEINAAGPFFGRFPITFVSWFLEKGCWCIWLGPCLGRLLAAIYPGRRRASTA
jgi:hypothetical protein